MTQVRSFFLTSTVFKVSLLAFCLIYEHLVSGDIKTDEVKMTYHQVLSHALAFDRHIYMRLWPNLESKVRRALAFDRHIYLRLWPNLESKVKACTALASIS